MCRRYRVEMRCPPDIDVFLQQVDDYTKQKGKAVHLLFNEIENDIGEKHRFLIKQQKFIENMISSYKNIIAKINILKHAAKIFGLHSEGLSKTDQELNTF